MPRLKLNSVNPGDAIPTFEAPVIDRVRLCRYAAASGDFNRIHIDEPFARDVGFPSVIAHGMLSMGFVAECLEAFAGLTAIVNLKARFKAVTFPGDAIRVTGRIARVEQRDDGAFAHCELVASRADGTVTVEATAIVRVGV
ncbi:MAG: MaoC family dehydratase N-terminal domain-containing protein [Deltaproteobacteria bacterium]|nr:MaoC family dehydratase N-terminal domain-containing protein [Deltaproteobacteria bacterium]